MQNIKTTPDKTKHITGFEVMYLSQDSDIPFRDSEAYRRLLEKSYEAQRGHV